MTFDLIDLTPSRIAELMLKHLKNEEHNFFFEHYNKFTNFKCGNVVHVTLSSSKSAILLSIQVYYKIVSKLITM